MLFFSKKYLLDRIKTEKITDRGFELFKNLLISHKDAEILNDNDLKKYTNVLINYAHKQIVHDSSEFFKRHGIIKFMDAIIDQFINNDNYYKLNEIINNDGLIELSKLVDSEDKNIFNFVQDLEKKLSILHY